jgi:hypothetical protein
MKFGRYVHLAEFYKIVEGFFRVTYFVQKILAKTAKKHFQKYKNDTFFAPFQGSAQKKILAPFKKLIKFDQG